MTEDLKYNGWTNKPTWIVALWLDNDEYTYNLMRENAKTLNKWELADFIKDFIEENDPLSEEPSFYSDLLDWAIAVVNYDEIAENYKNELES